MRDIDTTLVAALISEQFPHWSDLPVTPVARQGWDNRTFRLGMELSVRLPSGEDYAAAVHKEESALRHLAKHLSIAVPVPVATGEPGQGYPFAWSVRRWLTGETVLDTPDLDRMAFASDLGSLLTALRAVPPSGAPAAGRHSHFRGCHPSAYSDQVDLALRNLADQVDVDQCREIWLAATTNAWQTAPVWFHGDVDLGNLLTASGRLSAVIDFGTCGVGDPACDLALAWTFFTGTERQRFRAAAGLDDDTWRRARGWTLWKALATMAGLSSPDPKRIQDYNLVEVLSDPIV